MQRLMACLVVWGMLVGASAPAAEPLDYDPTIVRLSGVIVIEAFYGPPGYGEDPESDEIVHAAILVLDEPVSVRGDPNELMNSESVGDIRRIHLANVGPDVSAKTWRHVVIEGTLFHSYTGHHRTPVLMWVERLVSSP
ncbi:MAG: DUF4431 domain-containing protein [Rhodospirillales bacterium]|nr:DUF4431 domain-containing protein [Rhodospirillales bacterium]